MMVYFLKLEEVIRVGKDDTELMRIWGNSNMVIIEGRNGFTRLVSALALDASRDATVIDRFLEVGGCVQIKYNSCRL